MGYYIKEHNCKGCAVEGACSHSDYSESCPCIMCLVKVICVNELCDEYRDFQREAFKLKELNR